MNKIFCQNCGTKHDYASVKPKFCSACGEPFAGIASTKPSKRIVVEDEEDEEDEVDLDDLPKVKISAGIGAPVTFGDIYGSGPPEKSRRSGKFTPEIAKEKVRKSAEVHDNNKWIEVGG